VQRRAVSCQQSLTSIPDCFRRLERAAPRKRNCVVIFVLFLNLVCIILAFRYYAAVLHHYRVFSREIKMAEMQLLKNY
jgi:hypothetical protein